MSDDVVDTWDGVQNTSCWVHDDSAWETDGVVERSAVDIVELAEQTRQNAASAAESAASAAASAETAADAVSVAVATIRAGDNVFTGTNEFAQPVTADISVAAAGTNTLRLISERFADVFNVKDYGAKGDGTANDSPAIQAALAAAHNAGGGCVFVPSGTYALQETLKIGANTAFVGVAGSTILKKEMDGLPNINILLNSLGFQEYEDDQADQRLKGYNGHSNIVVEGFVFEGQNYADTDDKVEYGIAFAHAKNITVRNCEFRNWGHSHLTEFSGIENGVVENCHYHHLSFDSTPVSHINEIIQLDPCTSSSSPFGSKISSGDKTPNVNIRISGCIIGDDDGDDFGIGVGTFSADAGILFKNIKVENCLIKNGERGINAVNYTDVDITGNVIDTTVQGIVVYSSSEYHCDNYTISENTITAPVPVYYNVTAANERRVRHSMVDNKFYGSAVETLYVRDVDGLIFKENSVAGCIVKVEGCTYSLVSGSIFKGCDAGTDYFAGALTINKSSDNSSEGNTVSGNTIESCATTRGIRVDYSTDTIVHGNAMNNLDTGNVTSGGSGGGAVVPIAVLYGSSVFVYGNSSADSQTPPRPNSQLVYADSASVFVDGGNYSHKGCIVNSAGLRDSSMMQISGIQFSNQASKGSNLTPPLMDIMFPVNLSASTGQFNIGTRDMNTGDVNLCLFFNRFGAPLPYPDNTKVLGYTNNRWSVVYAGSGTINTSDAREKDNISPIDDAVFRAWAKVNYRVFQFKDSLAQKGEDARIHVGMIAQQIQEVFASEGLDAARYGLFCYDEWPEELDGDGNVVAPAGNRYSLRYDECLALEAAYQRWRVSELERKLTELEQKIAG